MLIAFILVNCLTVCDITGAWYGVRVVVDIQRRTRVLQSLHLVVNTAIKSQAATAGPVSISVERPVFCQPRGLINMSLSYLKATRPWGLVWTSRNVISWFYSSLIPQLNHFPRCCGFYSQLATINTRTMLILSNTLGKTSNDFCHSLDYVCLEASIYKMDASSNKNI